MRPGTLLFDAAFVFSDGTTGKKILAILNDGSPGYYVTAKATSHQNARRPSSGCNADDRFPNFFLPKGSSVLREDTWIGLDEFFELEREEVLQRHFEGRIRSLGFLAKEQAIDWSAPAAARTSQNPKLGSWKARSSPCVLPSSTRSD